MLKKNDGQGTVEYILVLVLIVGIISGVVSQFNRNVADYYNSYFGDYLDCLIQMGELPSLGSTQVQNSGACNNQFKEFSFSDGRPANQNGPGSGEGDGSSKGELSKGKSDSEKGDDDGGSSGKTSRGSSSTYAGGGYGGGGRKKRIRIIRRRSSSSGDDGSQSPGGGISFEDSRGSNNGGRSEMIRTKGVTGLMGAGKGKDKEEAKRKTKIKISKKDVKKKKDRNERLKVNRQIAKAEVKEDEGLTFGTFIRYLIIAGIIIALFVIIGSQLLKFSKELD